MSISHCTFLYTEYLAIFCSKKELCLGLPKLLAAHLTLNMTRGRGDEPASVDWRLGITLMYLSMKPLGRLSVRLKYGNLYRD